jgi:hypothetical protein
VQVHDLPPTRPGASEHERAPTHAPVSGQVEGDHGGVPGDVLHRQIRRDEPVVRRATRRLAPDRREGLLEARLDRGASATRVGGSGSG